MNTKVRIYNYDHEGKGISRIDNKIIFIPDSIEGELLDISITEDKNNYSIGKINNIIEPSPKRIKPKCPYYEKCGGCSYQHLPLSDEENIKTYLVKDIINKYTGIDINPIFISSKEYNYRNKIELKIENSNWGYYNSNSHNLIPIDNCLLAKDSINNIIKSKDLFNIKEGTITIRSNYNDEILIKIESNDKVDINIDELTNKNKIIGIILNNKLIYGEDTFIQRIGGYLFKVNINSFFQINLDILKEVFKLISKDNLGNVADLYCGVGTLGIASKNSKLYGIEIIPEAIKNALDNSKLNKQNNLYLLGDSSKIKEIKDHIDSIIIDPPRSGLNKPTLSNILDIKPNNIIYMSCNPITLARDLNELKEQYQIKEFYILNMFPRTKHIECLCFLERK